MKIVKREPTKNVRSLILWILAVIFILAVILVTAREGVEKQLANASRTAKSLWLSPIEENIPVISIDLPFTEYERILQQRDSALQTGVVLSGERDYARADLRFEDQTIPVRIRLKQGETDHLGSDDKWNFEIRTGDIRVLDGLEQFFLIDPMDNNGLNEAAFLRALEREGLNVGRYEFVQLFLNGEDKGLYALQEGFDNNVLVRNGQLAGVIVGYNTDTYWESLSYVGGDLERLDSDPITNTSKFDFRYFDVDPELDPLLADDEQIKWQFERAVSLLRGVQSGELRPSDVFDVSQYGRFLAMIDLWGATQATSLLNLRYFYNAELDRLQPVAMSGEPLVNSVRLQLSTTYFDTDIQSAYAHSLAEAITPDYLAAMQKDLQENAALDQAALSIEIDQELPWERLTQRSEQLSQSLHPQQPVSTHLGSPTLAQDGIIQVDVANVTNFPVEILGFDIDGATFLEMDPEWVVKNEEELFIGQNGEIFIRASNPFETRPLQYVRFHLPLHLILEHDKELNFLQEPLIQVATRLAGLPNDILVPARAGYPGTLPEQINSPDQ
ncbi:MAG: hypothetical protein R3293_07965 [Candidatus Promineifilaceae bacterium]|nr:hypothetical protein [Candidatus Promineifilaceae bacterium]